MYPTLAGLPWFFVLAVVYCVTGGIVLVVSLVILWWIGMAMNGICVWLARHREAEWQIEHAAFIAAHPECADDYVPGVGRLSQPRPAAD
jgi:hypothetical protein